MEGVIWFFVFVLGASLGSFYHVVGYRMPKGENWVNDRSRCPRCDHQLRGYELIPVFSYVLQWENVVRVESKSPLSIY